MFKDNISKRNSFFEGYNGFAGYDLVYRIARSPKGGWLARLDTSGRRTEYYKKGIVPSEFEGRTLSELSRELNVIFNTVGDYEWAKPKAKRRRNPDDPRDTSWLPKASNGPRASFVRPPPPPEPIAHIGGEEFVSGGDYAGRDLRGAIFDNAHEFDPSRESNNYDEEGKAEGLLSSGARAIILRNCSFDGADLQGVVLRGVIFVECLFAGADFRGATLKNVRFEGCDFTEADFRDAIFDGETVFAAHLPDEGDEVICDLGGALFSDAHVTGALRFERGFHGLRGDMLAVGADFSGCKVDGTIAGVVDFTNAVFDKMNLDGGMLDLSQAIVRNASARNIAASDRSEILFPPYERKVDFEGLDLQGTDVGADEIYGLSDAIRFAHWWNRDLPDYGYEDGLIFGQPSWRATKYRATASDGTVIYDGRNKNEMKSDIRRYFESASRPLPVKVIEDGYRDATEEEYQRDEEPYIRERRERTVRR